MRLCMGFFGWPGGCNMGNAWRTPPPTPSCPSAPRVIVRVSPKGFSQSPTLLYPPIILYQTQRAALTLCDGRYGPVEPPLWRYFQPFIKPPIDETEDWEYHLTE